MNKNRKILYLTIFLLFLIFLISNESFAQCAMCKANAESNIESGGTKAKGLNTGILYLMSIPYLLLGSIVFYFFRKQISEKLKTFKKA